MFWVEGSGGVDVCRGGVGVVGVEGGLVCVGGGAGVVGLRGAGVGV